MNEKIPYFLFEFEHIELSMANTIIIFDYLGFKGYRTPVTHFSFLSRQPGNKNKLFRHHLFKKSIFEMALPDLHIMGQLQIIPFRSIRQKSARVLS